jgi:hypothetical protein
MASPEVITTMVKLKQKRTTKTESLPDFTKRILRTASLRRSQQWNKVQRTVSSKHTIVKVI